MKAHPHSTADLRRINRNRVYRCLYDSTRPRSKQELAWELSMSLPTLTQYLDELLEQGLIDNSEIMDSTGGRKPHALSLVAGARFAVGMELSSDYIRAVAVDLRVRELGTRIVKRKFQADLDYAAHLEQILEGFLAQLKLDPAGLLGVGLTIPGTVDAEQQQITVAPTLGIHHVDARFLASRIPYPVRLSNDANAGGFAELWGREKESELAYLSLSKGIGGALLINGLPCLGDHARAGEFGHMCIHPGGRPCSCGRHGCLEAYCSSSRLSDELNVTLEEFFEGLEAGNAAFHRLWEVYLDDLSIGIANIHTMLDCQVVIGGKLSQFLTGRLDELVRRLEQRDPDCRETPYLSICRYHAQANGIGAALYFIDRFIRQI